MRCPQCDAPVISAVTPGGYPILLNPTPCEDGVFVYMSGCVHKASPEEKQVMPLFVSHTLTCPDAAWTKP